MKMIFFLIKLIFKIFCSLFRENAVCIPENDGRGSELAPTVPLLIDISFGNKKCPA